MISIGVDYYPEHWDRELWEQDANLMRESGVNVVRMAEFAWCRMEPEEGRFDFDWLDDAINLFQQSGISVVLGVPTMTPPTWLTQRYPDVLPDLPGQSLSRPGVRGHRCYNSPSMRRFTRIITERMAARYGKHPAVIGWQTDNEFSLHMCRCSPCKNGFIAWLRSKYGTLERLNRDWGTVVWSGEFSDWEQIGLHETSERYMNPSLLLDYRRFQSESVVHFQRIQVEEIRKRSEGQWITHNTWAAPLPLDLAALYQELDFASIDYYPASSPDKAASNPYSGALLLDLIRGIKGKNFWVMEQYGGPPGSWMPMWPSPYPGFIRAFAWQSISRGADGVVFFRWRSGVAGAEQFWHGLIDHGNVPGRRLAEFRRFAEEAGALSDRLSGSRVVNEAAILYDFDSHTALQLQPQVEGFDYYEHMKVVHRSLQKLGIGADILHTPDQIDSRYKLLVIPSLFVTGEVAAAKIRDFVEQGGTVVATPRTGVKQTNNQCHMLQLPGPLADLFGVRVAEYDPVGTIMHTIRDESGNRFACDLWNDLLETSSAEPIAWHAESFYKGTPAVTRNRLGSGQAYYVGTFPEEAYLRTLFGKIAGEIGLEEWTDLPEGVHLSQRKRGTETFVFVLNLSRETNEIRLKRPMMSLLTGTITAENLELEPYGVEILQFES